MAWVAGLRGSVWRMRKRLLGAEERFLGYRNCPGPGAIRLQRPRQGEDSRGCRLRVLAGAPPHEWRGAREGDPVRLHDGQFAGRTLHDPKSHLQHRGQRVDDVPGFPELQRQRDRWIIIKYQRRLDLSAARYLNGHASHCALEYGPQQWPKSPGTSTARLCQSTSNG
jgi:hypothetical protein